MPNDGLFDAWLPAIWTKASPNGTPPMFMMHRYLASDPDYAQAARVIQQDLSEPDLQFRVWQGLLAPAEGAPRLHYTAPVKKPAAEVLTQLIMSVEHVRRDVAEDIVSLLEMLRKVEEANVFYGVTD